MPQAEVTEKSRHNGHPDPNNSNNNSSNLQEEDWRVVTWTVQGEAHLHDIEEAIFEDFNLWAVMLLQEVSVSFEASEHVMAKADNLTGEKSQRGRPSQKTCAKSCIMAAADFLPEHHSCDRGPATSFLQQYVSSAFGP